MRATIRDPVTLRSIGPIELLSYLRARGWQEAARTNLAALWQVASTNGSQLEVVVPLDQSLADYHRRIFEALEALELHERRSQLQILADLEATGCDVVRARLFVGEGNALPSLEDGRLLHEHARNLILAAACAHVEPRRAFAKRKPERAMLYLRQARFGYPERGSYTLKVVSPVPPKLAATHELFPDSIEEQEPFERGVIRTLASALESMRAATIEVAATNNIAPMIDAVNYGVSANLCEAIAGLFDVSVGDSLDLTFGWESGRGAPAGVVSAISIPSEARPILDECARILKESETVTECRVVGLVQKLEHLAGGAGKATIFGSADGEPRTVVVQLAPQEHQAAIAAYEQRREISVTGELKKTGKSWELVHPRDLVLVEA